MEHVLEEKTLMGIAVGITHISIQYKTELVPCGVKEYVLRIRLRIGHSFEHTV